MTALSAAILETAYSQMQIPDGISATPPVDRGQTAAGLCHCSDIDQFDRIRIWLCLDRPDDIHSRSKVDLKTALRQFIGFGRNERPHMQHIIRACHTAQDIVVAAEVPQTISNAASCS